MNSRKVLQKTIGLALVILLLAGCSTSTPVPPTPGNWTASAEFEMAFTVNPTSTGITKITYDSTSSDWKCGSVSVYIGITFYAGTFESGKLTDESWPISDNKFTITREFPIGPTRHPLKTITIRGKFDETGTHASGTWEAVSSLGETCSGTWEASPRE